jgi:uncharacterized protein YciI
MWIIELAFTGETARLAARPAHRARLTELHRAGTVAMAGPYADESGALIVADVPDRAAVSDLLAADPYFSTPGVRVAQVRQWRLLLR